MTDDEKSMEAALERARARAHGDDEGVLEDEEPDVDAPPTAAEMRAAISAPPAAMAGPAPAEPPGQTDDQAEPVVMEPPAWQPPKEPVQTSAPQPRRLLGSLASSSRSSGPNLREAYERDVNTAHDDRIREYMRAAFTRSQPDVAKMPSALSYAQAQLSADNNASLRDLQGRRLLGSLTPKETDPSLVQRRKDLSDEARNRSELSRLQLEALERDRERRAGLGDRQLDERAKYHQGLLDSKNKPKGPGLGQKLAGVKPGDINTVPEQYRSVVQAIADGRLEAPKAASRFGADVLKYVVAYKPDFDATRFGNYAAVGKSQATDKSKLAIDVAANHLEEAERLVPQNFDPRLLNRVKNAFLTGSGSEELSGFELAMLSSAHEIAKTFGIDDQQGKQLIEHMFDSTQSPQQLRARIAQARKLMAGKTAGFKRQLDAVAPGGGAHTAPEGGGHGKVVKETKSFRQYEDDFIERK